MTPGNKHVIKSPSANGMLCSMVFEDGTKTLTPDDPFPWDFNSYGPGRRSRLYLHLPSFTPPTYALQQATQPVASPGSAYSPASNFAIPTQLASLLMPRLSRVHYIETGAYPNAVAMGVFLAYAVGSFPYVPYNTDPRPAYAASQWDPWKVTWDDQPMPTSGYPVDDAGSHYVYPTGFYGYGTSATGFYGYGISAAAWTPPYYTNLNNIQANIGQFSQDVVGPMVGMTGATNVWGTGVVGHGYCISWENSSYQEDTPVGGGYHYQWTFDVHVESVLEGVDLVSTYGEAA